MDQRTCKQCGQPIPENQGPNARYCNPEHFREWWIARNPGWTPIPKPRYRKSPLEPLDYSEVYTDDRYARTLQSQASTPDTGNEP